MITLQHTQECLSAAYVQALAGMAGLNLVGPRAHDYGVDGTFRAVTIRPNGRRVETGEALDFQLKSSTQWTFSETHIVYDLEAKTYNDFMSRPSAAVPLVLMLLCLPPSPMYWMHVTERELFLRHSCFWFKPTGAPTEAVRTQRVRIPRSNIVSVESLLRLMNEVRAEEVG